MRKHVDISRTIQFFDALKGSRTIAPEEDCPPNLNSNNNPKPNPNPNRGAIFLGGNCPDTSLKTKDRKIRGNCNLLTNVKFHELE